MWPTLLGLVTPRMVRVRLSLTPAGILLSQAKWLWFQYPVLEHNGNEVLGQGSEINSCILKLSSFFKKQARVLKKCSV